MNLLLCTFQVPTLYIVLKGRKIGNQNIQNRGMLVQLEKKLQNATNCTTFSYCYLLGVSLLSLWWETRQFPLSPWNNVQSRSVCLRLVVQHKLWSLRILLQAQWQPISGKCNASFTIWNTHISWHKLFLDGDQGIHHNLAPSMLTNKCWLIFMGMKQKKKWWKINKNGRHHGSDTPTLEWPHLNSWA